jgi:hypothetical protein
MPESRSGLRVNHDHELRTGFLDLAPLVRGEIE